VSDPIAVESDSPAPGENVQTSEMAVALRNGLKMGGSLLVTWSVALIVKLHVPAHLGPVRQGHFGFAESFATMFFAVLGFGVDVHIIKEVAVRPRYGSDIIGGIFVLRALTSIALFAAMGVVLVVTGRPPDVIAAAFVFGASCLLMAVNASLGAVLQAISKVGPAVVANIATKALWGAGLLLALRFDAPLAVLAMPALVGEILRAAILVWATRRDAKLEYRIDVPAVRLAMAESAPYFVNALALGVLSSLGMSVLGFIRVDEREVGWFSAVQNVAYLCMLLSPLLYWVVMPLLSRAHARSNDEAMAVLRRCIEGIVVPIVPLTALLSAGSDIFIHLAYGGKYDPAATGLSILSLVFIMTYLNMMLSMDLIILGRGWSVTLISISSVFVTAAFMLIFVPLGRRLLGEGGECAGAATAVISSEACVLAAMISRFDKFPLDARNLQVIGKSIALAIGMLILDRHLRMFGIARLAVDVVLYASAALAIQVVRIDDVKTVVALIKTRKGLEPVADP
jgi:O-antigen/teichoic acid export membrane protein